MGLVSQPVGNVKTKRASSTARPKDLLPRLGALQSHTTLTDRVAHLNVAIGGHRQRGKSTILAESIEGAFDLLGNV